MSGHSKWAQIKHQKSLEDKKRSQIFSKLVKMITIAVKEKGADPEINPSLRAAIEKAKAANMPSDNIDRAIKKASGEIADLKLENLLLEIYGPEGTAILAEAITDNKNRTISEIKHLLSKFDSRLAEEGSVKWMFEKLGIIRISKEKILNNIDNLELEMIDTGAININITNEGMELQVPIDKIEIFKNKLKNLNIEPDSISIEWVPKTGLIKIQNENNQEKFKNLIEALDNNDDISDIYDNLED